MSAQKKYVGENALLYVWNKVKTLVGTKVDKVDGKGLSTNDYTTDEKTKLNGIAAGAQVNTIESITVNGTAATITDKAASVTIDTGKINKIQVNGTEQTITNKVVNISVPTNNNQLTNGAGYQTSSEVQSAIDSALEGVTGIDFQVVTTLPATGTKGVIYLLSNSSSETQNIYDEYIWITDKYEKIGTTAVDLSNYELASDIIELTNAEIDAVIAKSAE